MRHGIPSSVSSSRSASSSARSFESSSASRGAGAARVAAADLGRRGERGGHLGEQLALLAFVLRSAEPEPIEQTQPVEVDRALHLPQVDRVEPHRLTVARDRQQEGSDRNDCDQRRRRDRQNRECAGAGGSHQPAGGRCSLGAHVTPAAFESLRLVERQQRPEAGPQDVDVDPVAGADPISRGSSRVPERGRRDRRGDRIDGSERELGAGVGVGVGALRVDDLEEDAPQLVCERRSAETHDGSIPGLLAGGVERRRIAPAVQLVQQPLAEVGELVEIIVVGRSPRARGLEREHREPARVSQTRIGSETPVPLVAELARHHLAAMLVAFPLPGKPDLAAQEPHHRRRQQVADQEDDRDAGRPGDGVAS